MRPSQGCESPPWGTDDALLPKHLWGWEETTSTHSPSHIGTTLPTQTPRPARALETSAGTSSSHSVPALTELWVKAKPSGLVTISKKMSMLSRMAVTEGSWPYSSAICMGRGAEAASEPLGDKGHDRVAYQGGVKKGVGVRIGVPCPRARHYLVGRPDAGGMGDPFP